MNKMRIMITGGGTGGHIYPALAIAKGLQQRIPEVELLYVGTKKGLEADIVPKAGLPFQTIPVEGLSRPFSYRTLVSVGKAVQGSLAGRKIVRHFKPHVVVGTGGYVCGPLVLAAATMGIPTVIHEQNAFPGLTNRILSCFASKICVTFEDAIPHFPRKKNIVLTGLPVREEIITRKKDDGLKNLGLSKGKVTVVVTGGSLGARSLNYAMAPIYQRFEKENKIQFYHITGQAGFEESLAYYEKHQINLSQKERFKIVPYLYQMEDAMAAADLIIGRAGASFLSEIMVRGIPSILVPYPYAAANHQEYNARAMEKRGAATVILDQDLDAGKLLPTLETILNQDFRRVEMGKAAQQMGRINALNDIIKTIAEISKTEHK